MLTLTLLIFVIGTFSRSINLETQSFFEIEEPESCQYDNVMKHWYFGSNITNMIHTYSAEGVQDLTKNFSDILLNCPAGMVVYGNSLYVASWSYGYVIEFNTTTTNKIRSFNITNHNPNGLCLDTSRNLLYVTDTGLTNLNDGNWSYNQGMWAINLTDNTLWTIFDNTSYYFPAGCAVKNDGTVYVVQNNVSSNNKILILDPNTWLVNDQLNSSINYSVSIIFDNLNNIYVSSYNGYISVYNGSGWNNVLNNITGATRIGYDLQNNRICIPQDIGFGLITIIDITYEHKCGKSCQGAMMTMGVLLSLCCWWTLICYKPRNDNNENQTCNCCRCCCCPKGFGSQSLITFCAIIQIVSQCYNMGYTLYLITYLWINVNWWSQFYFVQLWFMEILLFYINLNVLRYEFCIHNADLRLILCKVGLIIFEIIAFCITAGIIVENFSNNIIFIRIVRAFLLLCWLLPLFFMVPGGITDGIGWCCCCQAICGSNKSRLGFGSFVLMIIVSCLLAIIVYVSTLQTMHDLMINYGFDSTFHYVFDYTSNLLYYLYIGMKCLFILLAIVKSIIKAMIKHKLQLYISLLYARLQLFFNYAVLALYRCLGCNLELLEQLHKTDMRLCNLAIPELEVEDVLF